MPEKTRPNGPAKTPSPPQRPAWLTWLLRFVMWGLGIAAAGVVSMICVVAVALAVAYPNLPDISELADYRPKLPLRVFSSEGILIGEFGEERRNLTPIATIPKVMKDAVLAAEDARFYDHGGVDYKGLLRAGIANMNRVKSQGASTITMQVARNVYLSSEKTLTRKIYEVLLTFKLEHLLSKDQIFEIYLNQIYLGNRAYGFAAASEAYFGKPLKDITHRPGRDARRPAEGAGREQSGQQPDACARAPALCDRPHAGSRLHHRRTGGRGQEGRAAPARRRRPHPPACRIRGGDRAPADVRAVRRQHLHPRPQGLHHAGGCRPGGSLQGAAQGHHGLRAPPDLPRPREVRRPAQRSQGSGRSRR